MLGGIVALALILFGFGTGINLWLWGGSLLVVSAVLYIIVRYQYNLEQRPHRFAELPTFTKWTIAAVGVTGAIFIVLVIFVAIMR